MELLSCLDPGLLNRGKWNFFEAVRNKEPILGTCSLEAGRLIIAKSGVERVLMQDMRVNQQPSEGEFGLGNVERERPLSGNFQLLSALDFLGASAIEEFFVASAIRVNFYS